MKAYAIIRRNDRAVLLDSVRKYKHTVTKLLKTNTGQDARKKYIVLEITLTLDHKSIPNLRPLPDQPKEKPK